MNSPVLQIPARFRGYVYWTFGLVALALGGTQVGYLAAEAAQPTWLTVALAVWTFLGTGIGYTAATHVPAAPDAR